MIRWIVCAIAVLAWPAAWQAPATPRPGFTVTFDGGIFKHHTVFMTASPTTYGNRHLSSSSDPRVDRLSLDSDPPPAVPTLHFDAAPRLGTTSYDRKDEDDPTRNPYRRFDWTYDDWTHARGYRFDLVHVDVVITKLEEPGGRIEGTIDGRWELCTLPGDGGGNCVARAPLRISGTFSVVRMKDHVFD
jgi:hypothetical protein